MRIIVTGSRTWSDADAIRNRLAVQWDRPGIVIVHGACPRGVDAIASAWVRKVQHHNGPDAITEEPHPADWDRHGRRAGFIRNAEMVAAGADVCWAFIRGQSKGATHCARLALEAGIELHVWRQP